MQISYNRINRLPISVRLILFLFLVFSKTQAHQSPTTIVVLDITPKQVNVELQLPFSELSLALNQDFENQSEASIVLRDGFLAKYILAHTQAFVNKDKPWKVEINEISIENGRHEESNLPYKEIIVKLILLPNSNENTRKFTLAYDGIMHQVGNHIAYVSIRNDWESGNFEKNDNLVGIIRVDTKDNITYPFEVELEKGSSVDAFKGMISFGMQHIKEGTDHLLFILTLLLPACLFVENKKWAGYAGLKISVLKLLQIVTAFTFGHSITLLIGAFKIFPVPIQAIEILIAVSILISAIHAIKPLFYNKEILIAAGFGLIHGLAFSESLRVLSLGTKELFLAILGFNLGIEFMQLLVILMVVPAFILLSKTENFYFIKNAFSICIILISLAWIIERITLTPNIVSFFAEQLYLQAKYLLAGLYLISIIWFFLSKKLPKQGS